MKDKRILVEIDFDQNVLFKMMMIAHEKDVTLNQLVNDILKDYINKYKEEIDE